MNEDECEYANVRDLLKMMGIEEYAQVIEHSCDFADHVSEWNWEQALKDIDQMEKLCAT
jgi:hypothetical protein